MKGFRSELNSSNKNIEMNDFFKVCLLLTTFIVLNSCINKEVNSNHFWQIDKIELPKGYEIIREETTKDSTIVVLKLNNEQVLNLKAQILSRDNYIDSMIVIQPKNQVSEYFSGANWGKYPNGYYYQFARRNVIETYITLDTIDQIILLKEHW